MLLNSAEVKRSMAYNTEQLSPRIWFAINHSLRSPPTFRKIVEADRHGQYPFLYVIIGVDK